MKQLMAFLLVGILCVSASAGEKQWKNGILISYEQQTFMVNHTTNGTGHDTPNTTYRVQIDAGDRIYFAERTLSFAWQKFPRVTENGPIAWSLKGDKEMLIRDDKRKEFTLTLTKTRIKTLAEPPPH